MAGTTTHLGSAGTTGLPGSLTAGRGRSRRLRRSGLVAPLLLAAALSCAPAAEDGGDDIPPAGPPPTSIWSTEVAASLGEKLGGVTLGDVVANSVGDEIAVVGASGRVWSVSRAKTGWVSAELLQLPGEGIVVVAGELDGEDGDELVVGGMAAGGEDDGGEGSLRLLSRDGSGAWSATELHRSPALVHAVCLTDIDGDGRLDVLAAGFARQLVLASRPHKEWEVKVVADLPAPAKSMVPWKHGVALALTDGQVLEARPGPNGFSLSPLDAITSGRARLATDEERLLCASDDGSLRLIGNGAAQEIHRSGDKLRGAVLANLVPTLPGLEAATVGYDGRVLVFNFREGLPVLTLVHSDGDRLHHLCAGPISAAGAGLYLVAVGYSGRVLVSRGPGW